MKKRDYFVQALLAQCYLHKAWVLEAFSVVDGMVIDRVVDYPYPMARSKDGQLFFQSPDGHWELLEEVNENEAPFHFHDELKLAKGDLPNIGKAVTTTYGNALFNAIVLVYPFGDKIPYMEGRLKVSNVEAEVQKRFVDVATKPDDITPSEYLKFGEAMYSLAGFTQLCVPSATAKTMTADPRMGDLRAKLIEENKDHLNDPVVIAKIDKALVDMDRAWMKGDPGEGFYLKDKSYDVIRKRLYGMYGAEAAFGDGTSVNLIEQSLNDGWDISKLPQYVSGLRAGSFNRGHQTELGGAIAKEINRYCTNSSISQPDCGTKLGLPTLITQANKKKYLANYIFVDGKEILTDETNIDSFLDKVIEVRSPVYCKTEGVDYCEHCCGPALATTPHAIGSYISDIGSQFMLTFMAMVHGTVLQTAAWDKSKSII